MRELFLLDPDVVYLNHGSFGVCPRRVFENYQEWQRVLEREPVRFIKRLPEPLAPEDPDRSDGERPPPAPRPDAVAAPLRRAWS